MTVTAKLRHLRIAPRKVRLTADLVRGKTTSQAQSILNFTRSKSSEPLRKLLVQAVSNAKNNNKLDETNLYISKITVDGGPILKRFRPRSRGSAYSIQKKTSHITIVLDEIQKGKKAESTVVEGDEVSRVSSAPKVTDEKERRKAPREISKEGAGAKQKIFRRQVF